MKFSIDTSVLSQIETCYGAKAPQALWDTISAALEGAPSQLASEVLSLDMDRVTRHHSMRRRLNVSLTENAKDVLDHLNRATGKGFRPVETNLKPITQLLKSYPKEKVIGVIDNKVAKWQGTSMEDYLRPSTLFRASNFEAYVNEAPAPEVAEKSFSKELDAMLGAK